MPYRLVSPDRKLFLVDGEGDLKAVAELYKLTSKQLGNIRQLLGEAGVGNGRGDRNDRNERKKANNWVLFHEVSWLKHDNGTEYVPLVGGLDHKFSVVAARPDMNIGSMGSLKNLLNGSRQQIRGWRKVPPPQQVFPLRHGMSLVGLQACAALTLSLRATQSRPYRAYVPWTGSSGRQCRVRGTNVRIIKRIGGQHDGRHGGQRDERRGRGVRGCGGSCSPGAAGMRSAWEHGRRGRAYCTR